MDAMVCSHFEDCSFNDFKEFVRNLTEPHCARITRGFKPEDFQKLAEEPFKLLAWVMSPAEVMNILECESYLSLMLEIGFTKEWIANRLKDGTQFKVLLFPTHTSSDSPDTLPFLATWQNIFDKIAFFYGEEVKELLAPHEADIITKNYDEIDPSYRLKYLSELPVIEKYAHTEYLTKNNLLRDAFLYDGKKMISLYTARGFFYHSIGCNALFRGDGYSLSAAHTEEWLMPNLYLNEIPGIKIIDIPLESLKCEFIEKFGEI